MDNLSTYQIINELDIQVGDFLGVFLTDGSAVDIVVIEILSTGVIIGHDVDDNEIIVSPHMVYENNGQ